MNSLFPLDPIIFNLPDAEITYFPNFFSTIEADAIFRDLINETPWQQDEITVYNKKYLQPRLTALYGNEGKPYSYSNITMQPYHWTMLLQKIKYHIESSCKSNFNAVLLNYYRNGNDSIGWHSDNEKELSKNPTIASVSFGAERVFQLKHIFDSNQKTSIILGHGSLLLMTGTTQHFWKHQIPKTSKPVGSRINLTFRLIH